MTSSSHRRAPSPSATCAHTAQPASSASTPAPTTCCVPAAVSTASCSRRSATSADTADPSALAAPRSAPHQPYSPSPSKSAPPYRSDMPSGHATSASPSRTRSPADSAHANVRHKPYRWCPYRLAYIRTDGDGEMPTTRGFQGRKCCSFPSSTKRSASAAVPARTSARRAPSAPYTSKGTKYTGRYKAQARQR